MIYLFLKAKHLSIVEAMWRGPEKGQRVGMASPLEATVPRRPRAPGLPGPIGAPVAPRAQQAAGKKLTSRGPRAKGTLGSGHTEK